MPFICLAQGRMQGTLMPIVHVQICDYAHFNIFSNGNRDSVATNYTRAENVAFSQEIGEVATISAGIFAIFWAKCIELLQVASCKYRTCSNKGASLMNAPPMP